MKTSTDSRPRNASIAAEPVSPDVAPAIVTRVPRRFSVDSNSLPDELQRNVLEGERRTVKQFEEEFVRVGLDQGASCLVRETPVRPFDDAEEVLVRERIADERPHDRKRDLFVGHRREQDMPARSRTGQFSGT